MNEKGILYLVATPIGNLGDITLRALETLKNADIIAAEDTRRTMSLLSHLEIKKQVTSYYKHNAKSKGEYLISLLNDGKNIALVSDAGTPAISDPGEDLVKLCIENNIKVVPIPGATAFVSALICSGFSTSTFTFCGFLPTINKQRKEKLENFKDYTQTLIFYEAPHKLKKTLSDLYDFFGERKIAICRELTKVYEEIKRTTLSEAVKFYEENEPRGEFVLIIEGKEKTIGDEFLNNLPLKEHINYYMNQGIQKKDALKCVARDRGVSKRDVYNADLDGKELNDD
ncbi:MAG: 16S rRNA (cytidine(1402)-2'-O)-methyltransferase [Ruminococcaceae bacterium]|nr:16S rRNA (cytidine(1402)-2'-O)-methyltransferase [Oscillospiraceae bacterium]